jgi:hypothetical protein
MFTVTECKRGLKTTQSEGEDYGRKYREGNHLSSNDQHKSKQNISRLRVVPSVFEYSGKELTSSHIINMKVYQGRRTEIKEQLHNAYTNK